MDQTLQRWIGIWGKIDSVTKTSHHPPSKKTTIQQTRNEFIKKFNSLSKENRVDILLQTGISEDMADEFSESDASEIVQNMTDGYDVIHEVWNIMETMENQS